MLHLFRRHLKGCKHRSRAYRRCQCPIHVQGTLGNHLIRQSLDQTNWDAASRTIAKWSEAGAIGSVLGDQKAIADAAEDFLADAATRGLADATRGKYTLLLTKRLVPWSRSQNLFLLPQVDLHQLSQFRSTWTGTALVRQKTQERLRAFFRFCQLRGWVDQNPATGLSTIKVQQAPTLSFTTEEMDRILEACDRYPIKGVHGPANRLRMKAFVLLLRWTGLRIRDAVTITRDRVTGGKVFLYTQKTGTPVYIPVPPALVDALTAVPPLRKSSHVFWSGNGQAKSVVADWQRSLRKLFELADVKGGHAHRFRDTFAVELLLQGVELSDVSILLGHASIKVTEKHYAPWVRTRQIRLESSVRKTWDAPAPAAAAGADTPAPQPTAESAPSSVKIA